MSTPIYASYPNENSIVKYPNAASFPLVGNNGDLALALDTDTLYAYNTTSHSWVPIATPGAAIAIDALIGDVSATGPGSVPATVNLVGGQTAAAVASATNLVNSDTFVPFNGADQDINLNGHSLTNASQLSITDGSGNNFNMFYDGSEFKFESNDDFLLVSDGAFVIQPNNGILEISLAALKLNQIAKPTPAPAAGSDYLYFKAGDLLVYQDSAGVEHTVATSTSGANTALSNLITTSINQDLLPSSSGAHNLGSSSLPWGNLYLPTTTSSVGRLLVNNVTSLHFFNTANIFLGGLSGNFTMSGTGNVGVGTQTLAANTSGQVNVGIGYQSLMANTTGTENVAIGWAAMTANTTGGSNVAVGQALQANTTGANNVAIGILALNTNTTSSNSTAVGYEAAQFNTSAGATALGYRALRANTSGVSNLAVGFQSMPANTTGSNNTAIGTDALFSVVTGNYNTAVGSLSQQSILGSNNTSLGFEALYQAGNVSDNTAIGYSAGQLQTSYTQCLFLGSGADASVNSLSNSAAIGYGASVSVSNFIQMGNSSVTGIGLPGFLDIPQSTTPATPAAGHNRLFIDSSGNLYNVNSGGTKVQVGSRVGSATLSAGSVVVSNSSVTSNTLIYLTVQSLGTITIPVAVAVTSITPGTGFTISSADSADTSVVAYQLIEKA